MKKRYVFYIAFFITCLLIWHDVVMAVELSKSYVVCHDPNILKGLRILGYVVAVLKIMVPIILIITGMYSFFKATLNSDDKALKEATNLLIKKCLTGVAVFFIPTLIYAGFKVISGYDKTMGKFSDCGKCVTSVKSCNELIKKYTK